MCFLSASSALECSQGMWTKMTSVPGQGFAEEFEGVLLPKGSAQLSTPRLRAKGTPTCLLWAMQEETH